MGTDLRDKAALDVNNHASVTKPLPNAAKTFSLVYCFFVIMGGFVIDTQEINPKHAYLMITRDGILSLAAEGHFSSTDDSQISDRSKADILAEGLVCLQVTWMLVQCVARKAASYPLTALELHTFSHVCCALITYVLWLKVSACLFIRLN
jgi:hypothetical protein